MTTRNLFTTKSIATVTLILLTASCSPPGDRFETLMNASRQGKDSETLTFAREILSDPSTPTLVRARTEMTVALVHLRSHRWAEARSALDRAKTLGITQDTGYFKDHIAEYEQWIKDGL